MTKTWWVEPAYSKSRVRMAGKRIRNGEAGAEDYAVLENWRQAHAYVLNTFQMRLRHTRKKFSGKVEIAQRHKRGPTIVDKLTRELTMQIDTMHDIAGCRAICKNIAELNRFRSAFLDTRSNHRHLNRDSDKYDYIANPKRSGYRGMHDVYETVLPSMSGSKWNGLKVEIQFRTRAQHAWATAVETVDLLNGERAKFGQASPQIQRFFALSSELIARAVEGRQGPLGELSDKTLVAEFSHLDNELGIVHRLSDAVASNPTITRGKNSLLIFHFSGDRGLEVQQFSSITPAQEQYAKLERQLEGKADIVLVNAQNAGDLRRAFQNYFTDAKDFVKIIQGAYDRLRK